MPSKLPKVGPKSKICYKCTACDLPIANTFTANLHPLIGTLICRKCFQAYGTGDFANWEEGVDENGDDNYCRWCCDGGQLFVCMRVDEKGDRCHYSFCRECIERNLPDDIILKAEDLPDEEKYKLKWLCYACDKEKLKKLRKHAHSAFKDLNERQFAPNSLSKGVIRRVKSTTSTPSKSVDDSDKPVESSDNGLKTSEKRRRASDERSETLNKLVESSDNALKTPEKRQKTSGDCPKASDKLVGSSDNALKTPEKRQKTSGDCPKASDKLVGSSDNTLKTPEKSQKTSSDCPEASNKRLEPSDNSETTIKRHKASDNGIKASDSGIALEKSQEISFECLEAKLDVYNKTKDCCLEEINQKFDQIIRIFKSNHAQKKKLIEIQVEGLEKPLQDFGLMLEDFKKIVKTTTNL